MATFTVKKIKENNKLICAIKAIREYAIGDVDLKQAKDMMDTIKAGATTFSFPCTDLKLFVADMAIAGFIVVLNDSMRETLITTAKNALDDDKIELAIKLLTIVQYDLT